MPSLTERPRFRSVTLYNDPSRLLSFWYAPEWDLRREGDDSSPRVILTPDLQDPATNVVIDAQEIGDPPSVEERDIILAGIREGLDQLQNCQFEKFEQFTQGKRWGVEWMCTFLFDKQKRKRRARLFYSNKHQYTVTLQGSTEEKYDYWRGMFEFVMLTIEATAANLAGMLEPMHKEEDTFSSPDSSLSEGLAQ